MLDFSFGELLLLVVLGVIFIGPKELPAVLRAVSKAYAYLRALTKELRAAFHDLAKESGLSDAQDEIAREVKLITGTDGKKYPAYDVADLLSTAAPTQPPAP